ncbi:hypothetical protein EC880221_3602, partial [Escherichia coli 88.0221]
MPPENHQF